MIGKAIGVIILAAGGSSRLGRPKQLLEYRGKPLICHAVETAIDASLGSVIVVLGSNADAVSSAVGGFPISIVLNEDWQIGISSSIKCGLTHALEIQPDMSAAVLMLSDQPFVRGDDLIALAERFRSNNSLIVASEYGGSFGVPALFGREVFGDLMNLSGDAGAKSIIKHHLDKVSMIELPGASVDIDSLDDYENLVREKNR